MQIYTCNHLFTITDELDIYCKCYNVGNNTNMEPFNIKDIHNSTEASLEDFEYQRTMSAESLEDLTTEDKSPLYESSVYQTPKIIATECPHCRLVFDRKELEKDLLDDNDDKYYFLANTPVEWNKTKKYYATPPINLRKLNKRSGMKKTCSWGSISST